MKKIDLSQKRIEFYDNIEVYTILEKRTEEFNGKLIQSKDWSTGELICIDTKQEYRRNEKPVYVNKIRGNKAQYSRYPGRFIRVDFVVINIKTREIVFEDKWEKKK